MKLNINQINSAKEYDILIIGAGPSGIFTAYEFLEQSKFNKRKYEILIVESGKELASRMCPKHKTNKCTNCKQCNITSGFAGAGAFSDGKLTLSTDVGGDLPTLIGEDYAQKLIHYTDEIYLKFGATEKIEGISNTDAIKEIRKRTIQAGLQLIDDPIRHLGTEKAQELYGKIYEHLIKSGVDFLFDTKCTDILYNTKNNRCLGATIEDVYTNKSIDVYAKHTVISVGRKGASWLENICKKYNIQHKPSTVDIGVRVEVRNEIMEDINNVLYESKIVGYPKPFKNKVRIFCQNPGGYVSQENYDNGLAVVNGHAYKEKKSDNTNLAILCSHNFTYPFNQPIAYAEKIGELTNMLGDGRILVQRFGDILDGKRTWQEELNQSNVKPTLCDAVAGDITSAMPYRTMVNIINFIKALDNVVHGFASNETLLYSPEIKFYSNKIELDEDLNTNINDLYCLGDASGWTRGLMMASVMGVLAARKIYYNKTISH